MSDWPGPGDDVYYRRIMTNTPPTFDLGTVVSRPPRAEGPDTNSAMSMGVWEIKTAAGTIVTRKGWELRIISQR